MFVRRNGMAALSSVFLSLATATACAQSFPTKPIRIITNEIGGSTDLTARFIAQGIAGPLGQQVIVDNRGGSMVILANLLISSPPDGHTLLLGTSSLWIAALMEKFPYDPVADFVPITIVAKAPNVLVVHPSLPVKSVKELIALAKAKPGQLNYASGITGSSLQIAGALFKTMANIDIVQIPFKGMGPGLISTMGGQMQLMFPTAISVPPYIQSGRLRGLAVTSLQPSALLPGMPTVAETLPGYESGTTQALFAPAKTAAVVIQRLNDEVVRFLRTPEVRERLLKAGAEVVGSSSDDLAALRRNDMARVAKLIKDGSLRAD